MRSGGLDEHWWRTTWSFLEAATLTILSALALVVAAGSVVLVVARSVF